MTGKLSPIKYFLILTCLDEVRMSQCVERRESDEINATLPTDVKRPRVPFYFQ